MTEARRSRKPEAAPSARLARPFLKWVGGKRQLLGELVKHVPAEYGAYHEPFVGGGALFFHLRPERAFLSDSNERLIAAYRGVKGSVEKVIAKLQTYKHDKDFFLEVRGAPKGRSDADVAAWLIYVNKTAYNGLYRVNSRNVFNVPFGDYARPNICDAGNLRACAEALRDAEIHKEPFDAVLARAQAGDFVYFDPPYVPLSASSMFTSYTAEGFGDEEQRRLCELSLELTAKGVHVVLSNSSAPRVRELYDEKRFELTEVLAARAVNSQASGRGKIRELVIRPKSPRKKKGR
jgi:DNA adenine methylase